MASIQTTLSSSFTCSSSRRVINAAIHFPKLPRVNVSMPKIPINITTKKGLTFTDSVPLLENNDVINNTQSHSDSSNSMSTMQLYAILEAVADRIEMHKNIGEQRDNWNTLLLSNINMITLTAATLVGVAATSGAVGSPDLLALKLSSTLLFSAATGMSLIMNKIQPSQLAEEQRNATRLFKHLHTKIQTTIALGDATEEDVKGLTEKVLALDKAYPLPLLGAMLDKFPKKYEPAVWWPSTQFQRKSKSEDGKAQSKRNNNGWSEELEMELREVIEVVKRKDIEDYERLGNIALKINKSLAIAGPLLGGIAAMGSAFVGNGSVAAIVAVMAGSLAAAINAFEHGGQVGMVFEMYRYCGGFFKLLEETVEGEVGEKEYERRENGEVLEMKMALQLGRSVSQLRELATKSASCRMEGIAVDEFASKLF